MCPQNQTRCAWLLARGAQNAGFGRSTDVVLLAFLQPRAGQGPVDSPAGGHPTEGCIKPEIQPTFHSLSLMPGHRYQIHTEPPLGRGLLCHILESQLLPGGSPGLRLHGKEQSGSRPQLDKVWPLCPDLGVCVCLGGRAEARDVQEPEPGKSQAHTCLWM